MSEEQVLTEDLPTYENDPSYSLFTEHMAFSNQTHLLTQALIEAKNKINISNV